MQKVHNIFRSKNFILAYTVFLIALFLLEVILSNIFGWAGKDAYSLGVLPAFLSILEVIFGVSFPFIFVVWLLEKIRLK